MQLISKLKELFTKKDKILLISDIFIPDPKAKQRNFRHTLIEKSIIYAVQEETWDDHQWVVTYLWAYNKNEYEKAIRQFHKSIQDKIANWKWQNLNNWQTTTKI